MAGPGNGDTATGAVPSKPRLKINVNRSLSSSSSLMGEVVVAASAVTAAAAATTTPAGEASSRKVKLKLSASQPPTPATEKFLASAGVTADGVPVVKTKAGRQPKPTQKLVEIKKRARDDDEDDDIGEDADGGGRTAARRGAAPMPKIRIRQTSKSGSTQLVLKPRGRLPHHPLGDGYDSEASDREVDPAIEEQLIVRVLAGEHRDYLAWCVDNGKMGVPVSQDGAEVLLKFFDEESRRAVFFIKGQPFAAVLVDLPTITEAMKTWDKKSLLKSADICQMLYAFQKVKDESEARTVPLPSMIDSSFRWPHGLTPPMHDCVNRRFARTISRKEIEDKEAEVERLLGEDAKATSTRWEWVEDRRPGADDDDGEVDDGIAFFAPQLAGLPSNDVDDNDLEADLEAAFADDVILAETPATTIGGGGGDDATTPMTALADTPVAALQRSIEGDDASDDDDDDDDEDDDDDDDDDDEDLDEDQRAQRDEEQGVRDIIKDLEKQLERRNQDLQKTTNKILRARVEKTIKQLKSEIELKKSSIGIETDD